MAASTKATPLSPSDASGNPSSDFVQGRPFGLGEQCIRELRVEVRKCFEKALGMSESCACPFRRVRRKPFGALCQNLGRAIYRGVQQVMRILLVPGKTATISVDPNPQAMLIADCRHRSPKSSSRAVGKPKQVGWRCR